MEGLPPPLVILGGMAAVVGCCAWLAVLARRRGAAGAAISAAMAAYDEAFRATAHQSHHEIRAQADRRLPALSPDGKWQPSRGGARLPSAAERRRPRSRMRGLVTRARRTRAR